MIVLFSGFSTLALVISGIILDKNPSHRTKMQNSTI